MNDIHKHNEDRRKAIASNFVDSDIEKAKKVPIGTVHNGLKKIAEGKWAPVKKEKQFKNKKELSDYNNNFKGREQEKPLKNYDGSNAENKKDNPEGKHYSEMNKNELLEAAKKLKIKTDGLTTAALRSKVGDKIVDAHVKAHTESKKEEGGEKKQKTLSKKDSTVDFDWKDEDGGLDQFVDRLKKLGADVHDDGDNVFISATGKIPDKLKSGDDDMMDSLDKNTVWFQPANMNFDEMLPDIKKLFKKLGHTVKDTGNGDTYQFDITPNK